MKESYRSAYAERPEHNESFQKLVEKYNLKITKEYVIIPKTKKNGEKYEIYLMRWSKLPVGREGEQIEWIPIEERIVDLAEREEDDVIEENS